LRKKVLKVMNSNFSPVTIKNLREHFRTTYKLNEEQIDLMVVSSARSLQTAFLATDEILNGGDVCVKIAAVAHSLKGLLLNMGQHEWAGYAREIENTAKANEVRDYKEMMQRLRLGVQEVSKILTIT
jgi:HPt (histidine-containing phosphotransfer) domain-containing protein